MNDKSNYIKTSNSSCHMVRIKNTGILDLGMEQNKKIKLQRKNQLAENGIQIRILIWKLLTTRNIQKQENI